MSKRLDGTSMYAGINAGLQNTFAQLSSQYADGLTLENITASLTNSNLINTNYGATFASYMTNNFAKIDKDGDGKISASEIQDIMAAMATQGLTREQIISLGGASGVIGSLQETVLNHFDDIDKNHDGRVTNQEIQAYGVESDLQKQKTSDRNRMVNNMSLFYDTDANYEGSVLDYKYLDNKDS